MVGVDYRDGQRLAIPARAAQFNGEAIVDVAAVVQPRERVGGRELKQFLAARNEGEAERRGRQYDDQARNFVGPIELAIWEGRVNRTVEVPVRGGEMYDREIL